MKPRLSAILPKLKWLIEAVIVPIVIAVLIALIQRLR